MSPSLTETFEALNLNLEAIPFAPTGNKSWITANLHHVPPYLFRVYTPLSAGFNNEEWAKSRDARYSADDCDRDIFERDDQFAASMINTHLRWWGQNGQSINLVSWTSSLLFALQYIFYLHKSSQDGSSLSNIWLCIIDTRMFRGQCFIRDVDLIQAYIDAGPADNGLADLARLRERQHRDYAGSYYFGEYVSQGALSIKNKSSIVSASAMINNGLFTLLPTLRDYEDWPVVDKPPWANQVIRLREDFYNRETMEHQVTDADVQAAIAVATLFRPPFRLPMAAGLLSLRPRNARDAQVQYLFRSDEFSNAARVDCRWFDFMPIYETLPEVTQFRDIVKEVYEDYCKQRVKKLLNKFGSMTSKLRSAATNTRSEHFRKGLELDSGLRPRLQSLLADISVLAQAVEQNT